MFVRVGVGECSQQLEGMDFQPLSEFIFTLEESRPQILPKGGLAHHRVFKQMPLGKCWNFYYKGEMSASLVLARKHLPR